MKLTLDVENTVTHRDGKIHLDPFETDNKLVMVGCLTDRGEEYLFRMDVDEDAHEKVQALLDECTILIGHNIVHDLLWIWECGFAYTGPVFDTMLGSTYYYVVRNNHYLLKHVQKDMTYLLRNKIHSRSISRRV